MNTKFYDNSIFAENLKNLMFKKGITAAELSRLVGVHKSSVSDWLSGKSLPRVDKVDRMCVIFNCKREDFAKDKNSTDMSVSDELKFAFFGGADGVTDEMIAEVKRYAEYVMDRENNKNK